MKHCAIYDNDFCMVISYYVLNLEIADVTEEQFLDLMVKRYAFDIHKKAFFTTQFEAIMFGSKGNYKEIIGEKRITLSINGNKLQFTRVRINY